MRKHLALLGLTALLASGSAMAQVPSAQPTYNIKESYLSTSSGSPLANLSITSLAAGTAQTLNSTDVVNFNGRGAYCTWFQASHSGTPSVTMALQAKDAMGRYKQLAITAATTTTDGTAGTTQAGVLVYPGGVPSDLPTGVVAESTVVPTRFRIQLVIGGTGGPAVTGDVGCVTLP